MSRQSRRGFIFWSAILVVCYFLLSVALAITNSDDCGGPDGDKYWKVIPPEWECR